MADAIASVDKIHTRLPVAVWSAVQSLPLEAIVPAQGEVKNITHQQLEESGKLTDTAKHWLRNSSVEVQDWGVVKVTRDRHGKWITPRLVRMFKVFVIFPEGTRFDCGTIPETMLGQDR